MTFRPEHEIYKRRLSRNVGVGVALLAFVFLSFLLTVEKVTHGDPMHAIEGKGAVNPDGTPIVPGAAPVTESN
ncbi:hypothetical protein GC209_04640 [bacterium]|nr:hypothetical protein [bacterium]